MSDQESDAEVDQMVEDRPKPAAPRRVVMFRLEAWIEMLSSVNFHQRVTRFLEERQRREASGQTALEQRVAQLRREFQDAMTDTAMSFVRIHWDLQGRGAGF